VTDVARRGETNRLAVSRTHRREDRADAIAIASLHLAGLAASSVVGGPKGAVIVTLGPRRRPEGWTPRNRTSSTCHGAVDARIEQPVTAVSPEPRIRMARRPTTDHPAGSTHAEFSTRRSRGASISPTHVEERRSLRHLPNTAVTPIHSGRRPAGLLLYLLNNNQFGRSISTTLPRGRRNSTRRAQCRTPAVAGSTIGR